MEDFATYILDEKNLGQKMIIAYYLSKKAGIFFDKSVVLKTEITRIFMDYMDINVDKNLVLTAMLLCNCKKIDNAQKIGKLETYAKEGADYLETLGFNKRFCKICEEVNRYSGSIPREPESDILEVVDQFVGLILNRVEREAFSTEEALVVLQERNLKHIENKYLNSFITFVQETENIYIKEIIEVPILKKLVNLHNKEANVKTFIAILSNKYSKKIDNILIKAGKINAKELLEIDEEEPSEYDAIQANNNRALFSKEIAKRVMNHESKYKVEE